MIECWGVWWVVVGVTKSMRKKMIMVNEIEICILGNETK